MVYSLEALNSSLFLIIVFFGTHCGCLYTCCIGGPLLSIVHKSEGWGRGGGKEKDIGGNGEI